MMPLGMIEAHAIGRAAAAVMPGDEISPVAELLHHLDHVLSHGAEAVVDVVRAGLRQRAVAIAPQIREHDVIALRQPRRDLVPARVALGIAMQQKQRRTRSAVTHADHSTARLHVEMPEARKHRRDFRAPPAMRIVRIVRGRERVGCCRLCLRTRGDCTGQRRACRNRLHQMAPAQRVVVRPGVAVCAWCHFAT